jgi:hypothetical protein
MGHGGSGWMSAALVALVLVFIAGARFRGWGRDWWPRDPFDR